MAGILFFSLSFYFGPAAASDCPPGDVTGDCFVDMQDLALVASHWLSGTGVPDDMTLIPGGTFIMGDSFSEGGNQERPVHLVTLSPFYMGKYPVTNSQYRDFLYSALNLGLITISNNIVYQAGSGTSYPYFLLSEGTASPIQAVGFNLPFPPYSYVISNFQVKRKYGRSMANDPVVYVSWYGAAAYCNWRSEQEGREPAYSLSTWQRDPSKNGYSLPTESQWEYAARGGLSGTRFPWGDEINHDYANYQANGSAFAYDTSPSTTWTAHPTWGDGIFPYTSPNGTFVPNGYGLYDMAGNVSQWCNDLYGAYTSSGKTNPTGPATGAYRIFRGGYYSASHCRVAFRTFDIPGIYGIQLGFRLSLGVE